GFHPAIASTKPKRTDDANPISVSISPIAVGDANRKEERLEPFLRRRSPPRLIIKRSISASTRPRLGRLQVPFSIDPCDRRANRRCEPWPPSGSAGNETPFRPFSERPLNVQINGARGAGGGPHGGNRVFDGW